MMTVVARRYRPAHVKETIRFNGKLISCTESSAVMLADASSVGCVKVTQQLIRALSSEPTPDPKSPGLNLDQIDKVLAKLHIPFANREGDTWAEFVAFIKAGRSAIIQVQNADLKDPEAPARVGHAIFVLGFSRDGRKILGYNPLATKPKWYATRNVKTAMTNFAVATGVKNGGLRFGVSRKTPKIAVTI